MSVRFAVCLPLQAGPPAWPVGFPKPAPPQCSLESPFPSPGWRTLFAAKGSTMNGHCGRTSGGWTRGHHLPPALCLPDQHRSLHRPTVMKPGEGTGGTHQMYM